jgi:simple sugar transport system substrate-binding protein
MKKLTFVIAVFVLLSVLAACAGTTAPATAPTSAPAPAQATQAPAQATQAPAAKNLNMATVVKIAGINWFNRMEEGVKKFGADNQVTAFEKGPEKADAALQIPIIEDLIAQKVNSLCVIPMSPETLEPVLKKAMDNKIVVVTHEASNQQNMHADIEAFDNTAYGAHLMDHLAKMMNEEGEYAVFVGSLTSKTHNEWVDGAIARQKEKYPKMTLVADKQETYDDAQKAYEKAKELLKAHPNLKGFEGSASTDVAGIGQAIEEAGLADKTSVVGTSLPSISGKFLKTGAVDLISFWDPADAGYACNKIALMMINGKQPTDGMDLGIPGYDKITPTGKVWYGSAWVDVTKDNADKYPF